MGTVEGVILAAGYSRRAGQFKMLLPLGGRTVIEAAIAGMAEVAQRVIVVVGHQAERLHALLAGREGVQLVHNPDYAQGMFSSVRAGLAQVRAERAFLLPGDHPFVPPTVYSALLQTTGSVVIPTFQGRKGHPVLLDAGLIPAILAQPADSSLRDFIARNGYVGVAVEDEGILLDLDTPQDYAALLRRLRP